MDHVGEALEPEDVVSSILCHLTAPRELTKALGSWEQIAESERLDTQMLPAIGTSTSPFDDGQLTDEQAAWPVWDRPDAVWRALLEHVRVYGHRRYLLIDACTDEARVQAPDRSVPQCEESEL
jgi:hypothetical protein